MAMSPHVFFWPFDIGRCQMERERTRPPTHINDSLRLGVLAQDEGAELRLEAHLMGCPLCREASISLWENLREAAEEAALAQPYSCPRTRNALFRHLEESRALEPAALAHLQSCIGCSDHFLEPAKAIFTAEVDEGAIAAQD